MRRRGFLINSAALILIIPLLLLVATYEDVSSSIVQSQSERAQVERTYDVVTFLNLEFQKAMELSGKRAVVSAVDYVAVTGRFIPPSYKANNTIADLIRQGKSPSITGYDTERVMAKQTLKVWLSNVTKIMREQGYVITPSVDELASETKITVAPLDAFTIVIKGRIPHVNIKDSSGVVVYDGPIPSTGGYVYSTVDLRELEDPFHSAMTGGRYHRSLRACKYAFPKFTPPLTVANGTGSGSGVVVGGFGTDLQYNSTHIWDSNNDYITNLTINGVSVTTDAVVLNNGDIGVIVFGNGSSGGTSGSGTSHWCSSLNYRINLTVKNDAGIDLNDYQIPLLISTAKGFTSDMLSFIFSNTQTSSDSDVFRKGAAIAIYDSDCNPVPFWIEYWDPTNEKALIWIRDTIPNGGQKTYSLYFGAGTPTKGDGNKVFLLFDDFLGNSLNTSKWVNTPVAGDDEENTGAGKWYVKNGLLMSEKSNKAYGIVSKSQFSEPIIIESRMRNNPNKLDDDVIGVLFAFQKWNKYYGALIDYGDTSWGASTSLVADELDWQERFRDSTTRTTPKNGDWHIVSVKFYQPGHAKYYLDGNLISDKSDSMASYTSGSVGLVSGYMNGGAHFDWIFVRKSPSNNGDSLMGPNFNGINFYWRTTTLNETIESKPSSSSGSSAEIVNATAYDIQPLINCLLDNRYFAIEDGWSFFERLEGSHQNHDVYVSLARSMQDEMNYKPPSGYYPIGLVSFMIPDPNYDSKLFNLMNTLGIAIEEDQSSTDYYFLQHYFKNGPKVEGHKVWGISQGNLITTPYFSIDKTTACELLGAQGAEQLAGYSCG